MVDLIFHQVFWTLSSFLIFYVLMSNFFIAKVANIINSRKLNIQNIEDEISQIKLNIEKMHDEILYIQNYELPKKFQSYIATNSEAIEQELDMNLKQYKEELKQMVENDFCETSFKIDINKIRIVANELIERVQ